MKPVQDNIKNNLAILFVGFNPSILSSETGHHYANPTNRFWKILFQSGLIPRLYHPYEDAELLELGYGLTNLVSRPTKAASEITNEEYRQGKKRLEEAVHLFHPKIICYVGKGVYLKFSGKKTAGWGLQAEPIVPGTADFVAPSSSGLVRMTLDEVVHIYSELTQYFK